jgi:F-type H+-transporting ATPase subunit b
MNPLASPPLAASIMELNPGLTLWVAITFLVLIVVLAKVAWGPIVRMLDERERTIRDAIEQAKKERAEAEKLLAQQKESLAQARREAADLAKRNQQEVEGLRAELTAKARKEADDLVATARRTIEEETRKASAELKAQVADLAVGAATRIVKSSLDE